MTQRRREHNAMEVALYAVVGVSSVPVAVGPLPASLYSAPDVLGRAAPILLVLGCAGALTGMWLRDDADSLLVQGASLLGIAFGALIYALVLITYREALSQVLLAAGLSLGIGAGAVGRYMQLRRRVDRWIEATQGGPDR